MMRIITGKAKGVHLKTLEGEATRPTAERVKEAVFSMLMGDIEDRAVLDLFSGSGQMALEALSRGAKCATLVDKSPQAIEIIKHNAQKTKLIDGCKIVRDEYLSFIKRNGQNPFDVIFLDPPYASNLYRSALTAMLDYGTLKPTSLIICENETEDIFGGDTLADSFEIIKQARYGRVFITILMPKELI